MITVPQIKLKEIIEEIISKVAQQHTSFVTANKEDESWLYRTFNGLQADGFNYYEQAVEVFVNRGANSHRKLEIRRDFDRSRATLPTIFINTPSEQQAGMNAIGLNYDSTGEYYENTDGSYSYEYGRAFQGVYELMVTSANKDEAELIYRFLQAIFIAFGDTLNDTFNDTFTFSGKQLMPNQEVMPTPIMIRVWTVKVGEVFKVPRFDSVESSSNITFEGTVSL